MSKMFLLAAALGAACLAALAWSPAMAVEARTATIEIRQMKYSPSTLTITAGTKVTWVNDDDMPHTVTEKGQVFRSAALDTDDRFSFTFTSPGEFTYFCAIHPFMVGRVIVKAGSSS